MRQTSGGNLRARARACVRVYLCLCGGVNGYLVVIFGTANWSSQIRRSLQYGMELTT